MNTVIQVYAFGGLFYGWVVFMAFTEGSLSQKWLCTIPIWPLTIAVLLIRVIWHGLRITFEEAAR